MTTVGSFSVSVLGSVPPCGCWPGLAVAAQVPPEQRETTARALQATTKRKVLPLVHISSGAYHPGGGGVGSGASDCGGEPVGAAVGPTLAGAAPPGTAVVVWRCFGGTPPSDADLQAAYHAAAKQAVAAYQATTPVQAQRPLPAGAGLQCRPPPPKGPCGPVSAPQTAAAVVAPNGEARGGHRPDDDSAALPTRSHVPEAKEVLTAVVPLPIPCVSYSADFLSRDVADKLLALFLPLKGGAIAWATSPRVNHATAIYGDGGIRYSSATTAGYASSVVNDWTSELLSLRDAAETWYRDTAGIAVTFNVCLLNRYDGGAESLGWHADREEMDPAMEAPRASPIASVSIGVPRQFGLRRHGATTVDVVRLGHGSLCVMENACQFLYKHSLLAEPGADGIRINLTFRAKLSVGSDVSSTPFSSQLHRTLSDDGGGDGAGPASDPGSRVPLVNGPEPAVFVGLTPGVDHRPSGWKNQLHHPFESPFVDDEPSVAAARYTVWMWSQPIFRAWVTRQLVNAQLKGGGSAHDCAHIAALTTLVAPQYTGVGAQPFSVAATSRRPFDAPKFGELHIGNLKGHRQRRDEQPRCRDHVKGRCERGAACRFSHEAHCDETFAAVVVDRTTPLGNPFRMGPRGTDERFRDAVCTAFAELLAVPHSTRDDVLAIAARHGVLLDDRFAEVHGCGSARSRALSELHRRLCRGESLRLLCWCAPRRCHAEEIARWLTPRLPENALPTSAAPALS